MTLRARILGLGIGSAAAALVLFAVPVVLVLERDADDQADRVGAVAVQVLADFVGSGTRSREELAAYVDRVGRRAGQVPLTVVLTTAAPLGAADPDCTRVAEGTLEVAPLNLRGADGRGGGDGGRPSGAPALSRPLQVSRVDGGRLVSASGPDPDGAFTICALVPDEVADASLRNRLLLLGAAAVLLLAVVAAVALLLARRLVRDLDATAHTADRLGQGDLSARVPPGGPQEVRRVGTALNRLAGRIDELLVLERETVADLSHRLRTPLTAVRLDVEALPASAARDELDGHLDQLERTLTAVIRAARRPEREGALPAADPVAVVRERFAYWAPLLEDQRREASLSIDVPPGTRVRCAGEDLESAVDALLENAVAHTDEGVAVSVSVTVPSTAGPGAAVVVDVRDQGPGIAEHAIVRGRSDRGSSGLGLDIARSCAEASGGRLVLLREEPWAVVRLELGGL